MGKDRYAKYIFRMCNKKAHMFKFYCWYTIYKSDSSQQFMSYNSILILTVLRKVFSGERSLSGYKGASISSFIKMFSDQQFQNVNRIIF